MPFLLSIADFVRHIAKVNVSEKERDITDQAVSYLETILEKYFNEYLLEDYKGKPGVNVKNLFLGFMKSIPEKDREGFLGEVAQKVIQFKGNKKELDWVLGRKIQSELIKELEDKLDMGSEEAEKMFLPKRHLTWNKDDLEDFEEFRPNMIRLISKFLKENLTAGFKDLYKRFYREEKEEQSKEDDGEKKSKKPFKDEKKKERFIEDIPEGGKETKEFTTPPKDEGEVIEALGLTLKELEEHLKKDPDLEDKHMDKYTTLLRRYIAPKAGMDLTLDEIAEKVIGPGKGKSAIWPYLQKLKDVIKRLSRRRQKRRSTMLPYEKIESVTLPYEKVIESATLQEELKEKVDVREPKRVQVNIDEAKLENLKKELDEEEDKMGINRNPNKIKRLTKEVQELEKKMEQARGRLPVDSESDIHIKMVDDAIKYDDIAARIEFSAKYDHTTKLPIQKKMNELNKKLNKTKDDAEKKKIEEQIKKIEDFFINIDFEYKKYKVHFKDSKKGDSIEYTLEEDLTPEGKLKGTPKIKFLVNGSPVVKSELKDKLDAHAELMKKEGLLPWGQSAVDHSKSIHFPTSYYNVELPDRTYSNAHVFFVNYDGLFEEDLPQSMRKQIIENRLLKREQGITKKTKLESLLKILEKELPKAIDQKEKSDIEKNIEKIQKQIEKEEEVSKKEYEEVVKSTLGVMISKAQKKLSDRKQELAEAQAEDEPNKKKISELERRIRRIERRLKKLREGMNPEEKSAHVPISDKIREIVALTKEYMQLNRDIDSTKEEIKKLEDQIRRAPMTEERLEKIIEVREKEYKELEDWEKPRHKEMTEDYYNMLEKIKDQSLSKKEESEKLVNDLKKVLEEKKSLLEKYENQLKETKGPEAFPDTESEEVKDLYDLFDSLRIKMKNMKGFLSQVEFLKLAKSVQYALLEEVKNELKGIKKENREEVERGALKRQEEKLNKAREGFNALPADLKKRLKLYKEKAPKDEWEKLEKKGDLDWMDKDKWKESISEELSAPKKDESQKKKQIIHTVEKSQFDSMGRFIKNRLNGLVILGERFQDASLIPPEDDAQRRKELNEVKSKLQGYLKEVESGHEKVLKDMKGVEDNFQRFIKVQETKKPVEEVKMVKADSGDGADSGGDIDSNTLAGLTQERKNLEKSMNIYKKMISQFDYESKSIPALGLAKSLLEQVEYVKRIYNYYTKMIHFGIKGALPTMSKKAKVDIDELKLKGARDAIVTALHSASRPLEAKDSILRQLDKARNALKKFIGGYSSYTPPATPAQKRPHQQPGYAEREYKRPKKKEGPVLSYDKISDISISDKEKKKMDTEKKREHYKKKIEESLLKQKMKDKDKKVKKPMEKEELIFSPATLSRIDKLLKEIGETKGEYTEKENRDKFENHKKDILKVIEEKYEGAIGNTATKVTTKVLEDFINSLLDIKEDKGEKFEMDYSYLNKHRPIEEYKDMWKFIERHWKGPSLLKEPPVKVEPATIPTPKEIVKKIEEEFKGIQIPKMPLKEKQKQIDEINKKLLELYKKKDKTPEDNKKLKQLKKELLRLKSTITDVGQEQQKGIFVKHKGPKEHEGTKTKREVEEEGLSRYSSNVVIEGADKPIKPPIPSMTYQIKKEQMVRMLQKSNMAMAVIDELNNFLIHLKSKTKPDEHYYIGYVVDVAVNILKQIAYTVSTLKVGKAGDQDIFINPPDASSNPAGNQYTEEDLEDKIEDLKDSIDDLIDPDEVKHIMPSGLTLDDTAKVPTKEKERDFPKTIKNPRFDKKKSSTRYLAFKLAHKFSSDDLKKVESVEIGR